MTCNNSGLTSFLDRELLSSSTIYIIQQQSLIRATLVQITLKYYVQLAAKQYDSILSILHNQSLSLSPSLGSLSLEEISDDEDEEEDGDRYEFNKGGDCA